MLNISQDEKKKKAKQQLENNLRTKQNYPLTA